MYFINPYLKVISTDRGLGIFASHFIPANRIIEKSPFSSCWQTTWQDTPENLKKIVFSYPQNADNYVVGLGYTALYNHSDENNAVWLTEENAIIIKTVKDIKANTEVFIHYGDAYWSGGWSKY